MFHAYSLYENIIRGVFACLGAMALYRGWVRWGAFVARSQLIAYYKGIACWNAIAVVTPVSNALTVDRVDAWQSCSSQTTCGMRGRNIAVEIAVEIVYSFAATARCRSVT